MERDALHRAAAKGDIDAIKQYVANGGIIDGDDDHVCALAATNGDISLLVYLTQQGWPLSYWVHDRAAAFGQIPVMDWAKAQGVPFSEARIASSAVSCSQPEEKTIGTLHYLKDAGCPFDQWGAVVALECGLALVYKWYEENMPTVLTAPEVVSRLK